MTPNRGDETLRRHRLTIPGATYFLTLCTRHRAAGLTSPLVAHEIWDQLTAMENAAVLIVRAGVVMPDHLHLVLTLGESLELGQAVGRLKAKTRRSLLATGLGWQGNFHEHRLRPGDALEDVLRYVYLNPYRARLVPASETYPWFWLGLAEADWFRPTLDDGRPYPEWLVG